MLKTTAGLQMTHVPYKGGGPRLRPDVGQIPLMLENIPSTLPFVRQGKLRVLAVSSRGRSSLLPDVPTMEEAALKGTRSSAGTACFVPQHAAGRNRRITQIR